MTSDMRDLYVKLDFRPRTTWRFQASRIDCGKQHLRIIEIEVEKVRATCAPCPKLEFV